MIIVTCSAAAPVSSQKLLISVSWSAMVGGNCSQNTVIFVEPKVEGKDDGGEGEEQKN